MSRGKIVIEMAKAPETKLESPPVPPATVPTNMASTAWQGIATMKKYSAKDK